MVSPRAYRHRLSPLSQLVVLSMTLWGLPAVHAQTVSAQDVPRLRSVVRAADVRACKSALDDLATIDDASALDAMADGIEHPNADVARYALSRLGDALAIPGRAARVTPATLSVIARAAGSRDLLVRTRSADVLGRLCPASVEPLLAFAADADASVRTHAAESLGRCQDGRSVRRLIELLSDNGDGVLYAANTALKQIGPAASASLIEALKGPDSWGLAAVLDLLGQFQDPKAAGPIVAVLERPGASVPVRRAAVGALGKIKPSSPQIIGRLLALLTDEQRSTAAADALANLSDPRIPKALAAYGLRRAAWQAAGVAGDIERLTTIINASTSTNDGREVALEELSRIKSPAAVDGVVAAINHSEWVIARRAAGILSRDDGPLATPANVTPTARKGLEGAVAHTDEKVRYALAEALGLLRPAAIGSLLTLSADPASPVRAVSARVLGSTKDASVVARVAELLADPEDNVSAAAYGALLAMGPLATDAVLALVGTGLEDTQLRAIEWLDQRKEPRAAPVLVRAIEDRQQFVRVQWKAAFTLAHIRPLAGDLIGRLVPILNDEAIDGMGAAALAGIEDPRLIEPWQAYRKRVADRELTERYAPWSEEMGRLNCAPCRSDADCRGKIVTDLRCKPFTSIAGRGPVVYLCASMGFGRATCSVRR